VRLRHAALAGLTAVALGLACASADAAKKKRTDKPAPTRVQDLHYGDVLFQYFMGEDFEALTRLEAYSYWQQLPHHLGEAELLAGGLYLQQGMHNEAARRFESVLTADAPASVKDRAWFYLAKVWYARGYDDRAVESLERIQGELAPAQQAERLHMQANALMHLQRFDEAIALLSKWKSLSSWNQYARFNLGVALVRGRRLEDGAPLLDEVGQLVSDDAEMLALRDKANVALGYAWLQAGEPARALPLLERVRLEGPQSSRALLGLGWAHSALGEHEAALTPWLTLRDRNLLDAAVQEAYLAVPYAYSQLGAYGQAAQFYEEALSSFAKERDNIDASIARINEGTLLSRLLGAEDANSPQRGWFWQLQELPDAPESRYLFPVLAGNDFQEGLKNYRDIAFLGSTLARWDENMVVYGDMLDARAKAYAERTPRADALLASGAPDALNARRAAAAAQLEQIANNADVAALGTAQQRDQWQRIAQLEAALRELPDDAAGNALRDRLRLVKGALYWNLAQDYPGRLDQQRSELADLDKLLAGTADRWQKLEAARRAAPQDTGDFAARIGALQERMTALRGKLTTAAGQQEALLARIATDELTAQKQRIVDYESQTRFTLATIYDRAAEGAPAPVPPPGSSP
jgi:Tfp pilus assembly protein PilF